VSIGLNRIITSKQVSSWLIAVDRKASSSGDAWFLGIVTAIGVGLRLLWVLRVPPVQFSDFLSYWHLAEQLVDGAPYVETVGDQELRAFRPVGLPLVLAAGISLFGRTPAVPVAINLFAYVVSSVLVFQTARGLGHAPLGRAGMVLLALYPANIAMTGLAATEPLSICLYLGVAWALLCSARARNLYPLLTGLLLGASALLRPSLLPAVVVAVAFLAVVRLPIRARIEGIILLLVGFALLVTPWVVRNYMVFGEFVLISTNGGDVFYRANNDLATGGYVPVGARALSLYMYDEVLWNHVGYAWGLEWIRSHPLEFAKLAVIKLGMLLSNGAVSIEWTLKATHGESGLLYYLLFGLGEAWWILVWSLVGVALYRHRRVLSTSLNATLLFSLVLLIAAVHAVFESQPRYHSPMIGIIIVLAGLAFVPPMARNSQRTQDALGV
jgi:4-amino-4-deoxy-L-arabinose transferase-like glycosyltransferase